MFKNGATLRKDAWYMKLLGFMWEVDYKNYPNLCPLFWSVLGSIILFPFWLIIKGFLKLLKLPSNKFKKNSSIIGEFIGKLFFTLFILLPSPIVSIAIIAFIMGIWIDLLDDYLALFGVILIIICSVALIIAFILGNTIYLSEKYNKLVYGEPGTINSKLYKIFDILYKPLELFVLFIISVYKKCCPFINWK